MKTSEAIDQFAAAMLVAQQAIRAVLKDKTGKIKGQTKTGGSYEYEYKYSDLASVIDHVKPALNAAGIVFMQGASGDAAGVAVETRLVHTSGQWASTTIYLPVNQGTAQAFGSAITYGKRYGLQAMCGLPSEDDDGQQASQAAPAKPAERPNTATQVMRDEYDRLDADAKAVVDEWADEVTALVRGGSIGQALEIAGQCESHEDKLALYSRLDSDVRSKLKKYRESELATQP